MTATAIRHVILDQPLSCWAQMMTASKLAETHDAVVHLTPGCYGEPARKRPGMGSGCMPRDPERGYDRCRHDLAALRHEGAIDITDSTECWTRDGSPCTTCHGARGARRPYPMGAQSPGIACRAGWRPPPRRERCGDRL